MPKGDNDKGLGATGTERLYYSDARLLTFEARVVDRGESGRRIYLDRTAFYPTLGRPAQRHRHAGWHPGD